MHYFSNQKLGAYYIILFLFLFIHKKHIINFFFGHMPHHIQDGMAESKLYLQTNLMCFVPL